MIRTRYVCCWSLALALGAGGTHPLAAQTGGPAAVSGSGVIVLKRTPETLRMFVELSAKGKTLKDALSKLKERRASAEKRLAELGATADTIKAESPKIPPVDQNRQRQMEMMVRQRMRERGKRTAKKPEAAKPVTVNVALTADFPLEATDAEGLLLAANALEEKIRAADLSGAKEKDELSPEEEELSEEMASMNGYDDSNSARPGEPHFLFVAKISPAERAKALQAAFEKARGQAEQVSAAAGAKLGDLRRVSSQATAATGYEEYFGNQQMYGARYQRMLQALQGAETEGAAGESEALGAQAGEVKLPIAVTAEFSLK